MRFLIEVGPEDFAQLPDSIRQRILASLGQPSAPAQPQPVQQQPVYQPQPQAFQAPPVMMPTKQPVMENGKPTFKPDMGHFSQQSAAVDVMTGQPIAIGQAPTAPVIPQFNNAPAVQPVAPPAPVQQAPPMPVPNVDLATVKAAVLRAYTNTAIDGKATVAAVLTAAMVPNVQSIDQTNMGRVAAELQKYGAL